MTLLVLVPFESPTGTLKKFSSPSLKLACCQQQSGLRHGVKMPVNALYSVLMGDLLTTDFQFLSSARMGKLSP